MAPNAAEKLWGHPESLSAWQISNFRFSLWLLVGPHAQTCTDKHTLVYYNRNKTGPTKCQQLLIHNRKCDKWKSYGLPMFCINEPAHPHTHTHLYGKYFWAGFLVSCCRCSWQPARIAKAQGPGSNWASFNQNFCINNSTNALQASNCYCCCCRCCCCYCCNWNRNTQQLGTKMLSECLHQSIRSNQFVGLSPCRLPRPVAGELISIMNDSTN